MRLYYVAGGNSCSSTLCQFLIEKSITAWCGNLHSIASPGIVKYFGTSVCLRLMQSSFYRTKRLAHSSTAEMHGHMEYEIYHLRKSNSACKGQRDTIISTYLYGQTSLAGQSKQSHIARSLIVYASILESSKSFHRPDVSTTKEDSLTASTENLSYPCNALTIYL